MGGGAPSSSSYSNPTVVYPKIKEFQENVYPAMFGQLWSKAMSGDEADRIYSETAGRNTAFQSAAGAGQGMNNALASQGVSLKSPIYASLTRGLQENLASNLLSNTEAAARAKQASKAGYVDQLTRYASAYPPIGNTQSQQSSGGGGK